MDPTWKTKKGKISKFVDAEGYNGNEKAGDWRLRMGREKGGERKLIYLRHRKMSKHPESVYK